VRQHHYEEIMFQLADSHIHLFRNGYAGRYGRGPAGLGSELEVYETLRRAHGIAAALVVGYEGDGIDPQNNAYLGELSASRPWMATLAYARPAELIRAADTERLLAGEHRGVAFYVTEPAVARALTAMAPDTWRPLDELRALVSVNAGPDGLRAVEEVASAHRDCAFLIAHLGSPGAYTDAPGRSEAKAVLAPLLRLAALPNVHVKISGLYAVSDPSWDFPHRQATPFVDLVLEHFGPGRCVWGSDFSPSLDFVSFEQTVHLVQLAGLAEDDRRLVMGGNLLQLLGMAT
jgi:predicted TIM-barrel fold metal-dependent hydrolase